jgi:hypothetical protein
LSAQYSSANKPVRVKLLVDVTGEVVGFAVVVVVGNTGVVVVVRKDVLIDPHCHVNAEDH